MTTEADTVAALARDAMKVPTILTSLDGRSWTFNPNNGALVEVSSEYGLKVNAPPRITSSVNLIDVDSFTAYVKLYKAPSALIFADLVGGTFSAALDYHKAPDVATHNAHSAKLTLRPSEEWARWSGIDGKMLGQMEFAQFLEENAGDIVEPDGAEVFEIARDLSAKRNVNWSKAVRLDNGDEAFEFTEETSVTRAGKGVIEMPRSIKLKLPLWFNDKPTEVTAFLRWHLRDGTLTLGIKMFRREFIRQASIKLIGTQIVEATGAPVLYGAQ